MKNYTEFKGVKVQKVIPITHYCIKNSKGEDVEVPYGLQDYKLVDDYIWFSNGTKRLNNQFVFETSPEEQFIAYIVENLDSILAGRFISETDVYPQFRIEFNRLKEMCQEKGLNIATEFPGITEKLGGLASNYNVKKVKWLRGIYNSKIYGKLPKEVQDKVRKYSQNN
jgi:hypothetical protein